MSSNAKRDYFRQYRSENPGKKAAYDRRYRERHPEVILASVKDWKRRNPEKVKAHNAAYKLPCKPCEVCGNPKSERHHDDYSKLLDVRYLCRQHHKEHHRVR